MIVAAEWFIWRFSLASVAIGGNTRPNAKSERSQLLRRRRAGWSGPDCAEPRTGQGASIRDAGPRPICVVIRPATPDDSDEIRALIERSARVLGTRDYTDEQIEAALAGAWGLDTQLIRDGTLFVAEVAGCIAACGAWSYRRTLFGSDARRDRDDSPLDPERDAARIRAFFVDPRYAGRGFATALLGHCETAARERGYLRVELAATAPGRRFYSRHGYSLGETYEFECGRGIRLPIYPMSKSLK